MWLSVWEERLFLAGWELPICMSHQKGFLPRRWSKVHWKSAVGLLKMEAGLRRQPRSHCLLTQSLWAGKSGCLYPTYTPYTVCTAHAARAQTSLTTTVNTCLHYEWWSWWSTEPQGINLQKSCRPKTFRGNWRVKGTEVLAGTIQIVSELYSNYNIKINTLPPF